MTINRLAGMVMDIAGKKQSIKNVPGPLGVRGRNSDIHSWVFAPKTLPNRFLLLHRNLNGFHAFAQFLRLSLSLLFPC